MKHFTSRDEGVEVGGITNKTNPPMKDNIEEKAKQIVGTWLPECSIDNAGKMLEDVTKTLTSTHNAAIINRLIP